MENRYNILIADDESNFREVVKDYLSAKNFNVLCAADKEETIRKVLNNDIHVLLLDKRFPSDGDGMEVLHKVRNFKPQMEVIVLTAYPETDSNLESMQAGAAAYLIKTVDYERLLNSVEHLIEVIRLRKKNLLLIDELKKKNQDLEFTHDLVNSWNEGLMTKIKEYSDFEKGKMSDLENSNCRLDNTEIFVLGLMHETSSHLKLSEKILEQIGENSIDKLTDSLEKLFSISRKMWEIANSYFEIVLHPEGKEIQFDIKKSVEKILFFCNLETWKKKVKVSCKFSKNLPKITGNPRRFLGSLLNILKFSCLSAIAYREVAVPVVSMNIFKNAGAPKPAAHDSGTQIVIEISGTGKELSPPLPWGSPRGVFREPDRRRIFQADDISGLSLSKDYFESYGGTIAFQRTDADLNRFRITLPPHGKRMKVIKKARRVERI